MSNNPMIKDIEKQQNFKYIKALHDAIAFEKSLNELTIEQQYSLFNDLIAYAGFKSFQDFINQLDTSQRG